jgi:hypothetical protein
MGHNSKTYRTVVPTTKWQELLTRVKIKTTISQENFRFYVTREIL